MTKEEKVGRGHPPKDTRWKPGQSGNPKGRPPKNLSITSLVKEKLEQEGPEGKTNAELIADAIIELAVSGDLSAIKELLDRTDGKVIDRTDHTFYGEGLPEILAKLRGYSSPELTDTKLIEG